MSAYAPGMTQAKKEERVDDYLKDNEVGIWHDWLSNGKGLGKFDMQDNNRLIFLDLVADDNIRHAYIQRAGVSHYMSRCCFI